MVSSSSPSNPLASIEDLMKAGQQSMKQFDDAIAAAMGVSSSRPASEGMSPFAAYPEFVTQAWRLWNASIVNAFTMGAASSIQPARGDKRFKDDAWQQSPYYDLLKQSYLQTSKQLADLVDQAQVDDKSKLQLRFYARQFIDAMSPSNFPATNPDVIRTAIQTRSASLASRDAEPDRGYQERAHYPGRRIRL